jgi:hypothetical protein
VQILGIGTALVITVAAVVIAVGRGNDAADRLRAAGPPAAATTTTAPAAVLPAADGNGAPPTPSPSPGQPAAPGDGGDFSPDLGPAPFEFPNDPRLPPTPPPTNPAVAVALCAPAQVDQSLVTDKPTYAAGDIVAVTATVTNKSSFRCAVVDPASPCFSLLAAYGSGDDRPFWRNRYVPVTPCPNLPRILLLPGGSAQLGGSWDQSDNRDCMPYGTVPACTKPRVAGSYTIRSTWLAQEVTASIDLS